MHTLTALSSPPKLTSLTGVVAQRSAQTAVHSDSSMPPYLHTRSCQSATPLVRSIVAAQQSLSRCVRVWLCMFLAALWGCNKWSAGNLPCLMLHIRWALSEDWESVGGKQGMDTISLEDSWWRWSHRLFWGTITLAGFNENPLWSPEQTDLVVSFSASACWLTSF